MFSSLRIHNYRLYFAGQATSLCGTWMQSLAQGWLVLQLTNSGTAVGLLLGFQMLPVLLLGAWGGVIADRYSKRNLLYLTQLGAAALALLLGCLVATGSVELWMVYGIAAGLGLITAVDNPTRQAFVSELVGRDSLPNAVALNSTAVNLARLVGPTVGGILIAHVGLAACFFVNAASYGAVILMLSRLRGRELHVTPPVARRPGQLREGLAYVRATPVLWTTLCMLAIVGTLTYEFPVTLPLMAKFTFGAEAGAYAALMGAMGAGAVVGGLFSASRRQACPARLTRVAFVFGAVVLVAAVMPTLPLTIAAMFAVGFVSIFYTSLSNTTLQLQSEPAMRGRVMALWAVAFLGSTPIGGPLVGWVCQEFSPRWGLALGGVGAILAGCLGLVAMPGGGGLTPLPRTSPA